MMRRDRHTAGGREFPLLLPVLLLLTLTALPGASAAATFTILNQDGPGEGLNDTTPRAAVGGNSGTTLGQQRLIAVQYAANTWGALLGSNVDIRVQVAFNSLACSSSSAILGSAGPLTSAANFSGALQANTFYPIALANALAGTDIDPGGNDINAQLNFSIDAGCLSGVSGYYYGTDGNLPGGTINLQALLLHELGHGLGFTTFVNLSTGAKPLGFDDPFMRNLEDHSTAKLWPDMTNGERVTSAIDDADLHWVGANVVAAAGFLVAGRHASGHVQMYAPTTIASGSSVAHFDTDLSPNELMEPSLNNNALILLATQAMYDLGWPLPGPSNTPTITSTATITLTPTITSTPSITPTASNTATETLTRTPTDTATETPTRTPTATMTPTRTLTSTPTQSPTRTPTSTLTQTPTRSATSTVTATRTGTSTPTHTSTRTPTNTLTQTPTRTGTVTLTPTRTGTPTITPLASATPTETTTVTATPTASDTPTETATPTATASPTATATAVLIKLVNPIAGRPNGFSCLSAEVTTGGQPVATTSNILDDPSLTFTPLSCTISPLIGPSSGFGKSLSASLSPGAADVSIAGNSNLLPDGSLYTCELKISATAAVGSYPIGNSASTQDPGSGALPTVATGSTLVVTTCTGDCNGNGTVSLGELTRVVSLLLGAPLPCNAASPSLSCPVADANSNGTVSIGEVTQTTVAFLNGCP